MSKWAKGSVPGMVQWILASIMLVASGVLYRHLEPKWHGTGTVAIQLPTPLTAIPDRIGEWEGETSPIPAVTEAYMRRNFADDYVSKRYVNRRKNMAASLYVVYCASRPAGILGHKPDVCYPAHGWIKDHREASAFETASGRQVPCLLHRMHKPLPAYAEAVVLSFYVANGETVTNEDAFSGLMGRQLNLSGDPARYVAQVQISSSTESAVRALAADIVDQVLELLPNAGRGDSAVQTQGQ